MNDARRLLWRAEAGLMHGDVASARLRDAIARLVTEYRAQEPSWRHFARPGTSPFDICTAFDAAIDDALEALRAAKFRACVAFWQSAQAAWRDLQLAAGADRAIGDAEAALGEVRAALRSELHEWLDLPDAYARLLRRAVALFTAGEYRQARFVAETCRRQAEGLLQRGGPLASVAELREGLVGLRGLAARPQVRHVEDVPLGEALRSVEDLIEDKRFVLAKQVLDHLHRVTAAARTCLDLVDREPLRNVDATGILRAPAPISSSAWWRDATERLLEAELGRVASMVETATATAQR